MMEPSEKRRHKRYEVQDVYGNLLFTIDVNVINMSLDGMAVESSKRLNVGRAYSLKLRHGNKLIKLTGKVVWCILTRSDRKAEGSVVPVYKAGLVFEDVISDKTKEIVDFMEENVIIKLEKRLFGRFKLKPNRMVNLDTEYDFLVKSISLSGMLVETEISPEVGSIFDMEVKFNATNILIKGRITRVVQLSEEHLKQLSHLGIDFIEISEANRARLEKFISEEVENA